MNVKIPDDELLITRTFDVPPATLFALWSKPEHVKRWIGPSNFVCREAEIDFRVGGAYRVLIASPEHGEISFSGVYREIIPDRRLVFTFAWDNDGPSAGAETLVTITFEEHRARLSRPSIKDLHDSVATASPRWTEAFDKLAAYATNIAKEHIK